MLSGGSQPRPPILAAASSRDAADRYVQALRTGDVESFLGTLAPEAERRAAAVVLAGDHVDRYTCGGQHPTEDGSIVFYAVERDTPDGTHVAPLVVWLEHAGRVLRSTL